MSLLNTSVKVWVKEKKPIIDKDIEKRLKPLMEAYNLDASAFIQKGSQIVLRQNYKIKLSNNWKKEKQQQTPRKTSVQSRTKQYVRPQSAIQQTDLSKYRDLLYGQSIQEEQEQDSIDKSKASKVVVDQNQSIIQRQQTQIQQLESKLEQLQSQIKALDQQKRQKQKEIIQLTTNIDTMKNQEQVIQSSINYQIIQEDNIVQLLQKIQQQKSRPRYKKDLAATKIQAFQRMRYVRKQFLKYKNLEIIKKNSIVMIQKWAQVKLRSKTKFQHQQRKIKILNQFQKQFKFRIDLTLKDSTISIQALRVGKIRFRYIKKLQLDINLTQLLQIVDEDLHNSFETSYLINLILNNIHNNIVILDNHPYISIQKIRPDVQFLVYLERLQIEVAVNIVNNILLYSKEDKQQTIHINMGYVEESKNENQKVILETEQDSKVEVSKPPKSNDMQQQLHNIREQIIDLNSHSLENLQIFQSQNEQFLDLKQSIQLKHSLQTDRRQSDSSKLKRAQSGSVKSSDEVRFSNTFKFIVDSEYRRSFDKNSLSFHGSSSMNEMKRGDTFQYSDDQEAMSSPPKQLLKLINGEQIHIIRRSDMIYLLDRNGLLQECKIQYQGDVQELLSEIFIYFFDKKILYVNKKTIFQIQKCVGAYYNIKRAYINIDNTTYVANLKKNFYKYKLEIIRDDKSYELDLQLIEYLDLKYQFNRLCPIVVMNNINFLL